MIEYNKNELAKVSGKYGFVRDTFEKVLRLTEVLRFIFSDEILSQHLILKGGTAINLALFDLPRLSVDIDLDYVPNSDRDEMLKNRTIITDKITAYMQNEGYALSPNSRFFYSRIHGGRFYCIKSNSTHFCFAVIVPFWYTYC